MASKKISSGSEEFMMFKEFWRIYQEYYEPEDNEEYWTGFMNDVSRFYTDFSEIQIAKDIAQVLMDHFEQKAKSLK